MRALEAAAFASGISEAELQARAGAAVAEEVVALLQPGQRVAVLAGHGNNGRDGMVAARWLLEHGRQVALVLGPRHAITDAELQHVRDLAGAIVDAQVEAEVDTALAEADIAVDALAGIGTHGALREPLAGLVRKVNRATADVVALDIPSGIDADTGEVPGEAVWARLTVTLGAVKQGLLRFPAAERVGRLVVRDIGTPEADVPYTLLSEGDLVVPRRPLDAHKYRFGRVLVVAGSDHFLGAAVLCASAAARAGAGLVTVASTPLVKQAVAAHLPEATYTMGELGPYLESHNAVVVGPGLGRAPETQRLVESLLDPGRPTLLDADALYALGDIPGWWERVGPETILTPHAGELARLAGPSAGEAPWAQAGRLAAQWGCWLVAKGPFTCVAGPDGRVAVWPRANAALATGGTGDVLAGLCGGLLAQGASAGDAARLGVAAHGLAAARVIEQRGWRTLLASDLLIELPAVLNDLSSRHR